MPNSYTTTSTQGFFSRLMSSFVGILLGPVLVIGAIILLSWNEGRAVQAIRGLAEAGGAVIESPADPASGNEGKLIHITGKAEAAGPIQDADLSLNFADQVAVNRTAEMYQWKEKKEEKTSDNTGGSQTTTTTYTYSQVWSEEPIDSSTFAHPEGHENPQMPFTSHKYSADDAKLGGFTLDATTLDMIDESNPLKPDSVPDGWAENGTGLYKGANANTPAVGDMRVHYNGLASGSTISVLARQTGSGFTPYTTSNGYTIHLAQNGAAPAADMIKKQQEAEATITWILRGVGTFVIFIGFAMFFGPIATLAAIIPFLGSLVRGATTFFAFVLAIPVSLITIAIAWIAFRPLIGGGILIVAAGLGYMLWRWHHTRSAAHVAATTAPKPA